MRSVSFSQVWQSPTVVLRPRPEAKGSDRPVYELTRETPTTAGRSRRSTTCASPRGGRLLSSYRLRDGVPPVRDLCLVARDDLGIIGGAIRFWPVRVGRSEALLLGPVAVHPTRQGEGLGGALIREGMARAEAARWPRVILVGDAPYYGASASTRLDGVEMPPPTNPDRVCWATAPGTAWTGRVTPWAH
jgi:predicted N-acetyltransferase YhbS